jgi:hypothetical protein
MTAIERRRRVILDAELDGLRDRLAGNLGDRTEAEIDARGDAACGDDVAVSHEPGLLVRGSDKGQEIRVGPVRRGTPSAEQAGGTQNERAGADRGDILCAARLRADELDGLPIVDCIDDTAVATGDTDQIEGRTVREGVRRHQAEPAIAGYRSLRFGDDVGCRLGQSGQDLQWAGEV